MPQDCERRVFPCLGASVQVTLMNIWRPGSIPITHISVKEGTRPSPWVAVPSVTSTSRSPEEIIRSAWERRDDIDRQSSEPFLREALLSFFQQIESGALRIGRAENHWPTPDWTDRAIILRNLLLH
jgi:hypothetical protein